MKTLLSLLLLALPLFSAPAIADSGDSGNSGEVAKLHDLFHRDWEARLREDPLFATSVGRHEYDDRLPDLSFAELQRQAEETRGFLAELDKIDRAQLPAEEVVNADIFRSQLENRLADFTLGIYQMPFNADSGFHSEFAQLGEEVPLANAHDYENYIARLRAWPRMVAQEIELMRMGIQRGFTVPRAVLDGYETTISTHVVDDPAKSVFWPPFERFPATMPDADRARLRQAGRDAVLHGAVAGYRDFLDFYRKEYLPHARTTIGASELPNGRDFYQQQIRRFTTLDLTPEQIHQIGLAEVDRIQKEMGDVIRQTGFQGDFPAFLKHLRSDPKFYPKSGDELMKDASYIAKQIDGKLPAMFGKLPRLPYTVQPVPAAIAPKYTAGRYYEAPAGSTQPGTYWVNLYKPETRALYNLTALTLHEAVPGHHLQIALSRELENLPDFRRYSYISAFGEGWGLYSEWLGLEMGMYTDPYSNFGRLTYEMWRACRLVVDTGLHSQGWKRQQAIDYLASHTALPMHEVETETDRYISWPGQALAYKLGELKIKELRKRAEQALGERFDVRAFHDVVLGSGSVPLKVLEDNVDRWIAATRTAR
jgi:uncharacterized protein (DUF885 family)